MKIDFYEKLFLALTVVMLVVILAAVASAALRHGITLPHPTQRIDPAALRSDSPPPPFDQLGVREIGPNEYEVNLIAAMWQFEPYFNKDTDVIRLPVGATVTFHLASPDIVHGFRIRDTNVNTMVIPGQMSTVTATFDQPGEYLGMCHEYCGAGHQGMFVKILVGDDSGAPASTATTESGTGG